MKFKHNWLVAAGCALLAACGNPQQDWEDARLIDTRQAYSDFLEAYPQGDYAERARTRIAELERETAWRGAEQTANAEAYSAFLNQYPDGAHSREARERLSDLEREAAWDRLGFEENITLESLREFVMTWPVSTEADQARAMIASLETDAAAATGPVVPPVGETGPQTPSGDQAAPAEAAPAGDAPAAAEQAFRVQLGAFRAEETAQAERDRLEQAHGALLGEAIVQPAATDPPLYRVRSAPMTREEARETCATLASQNQACIVVGR